MDDKTIGVYVLFAVLIVSILSLYYVFWDGPSLDASIVSNIEYTTAQVNGIVRGVELGCQQEVIASIGDKVYRGTMGIGGKYNIILRSGWANASVSEIVFSMRGIDCAKLNLTRAMTQFSNEGEISKDLSCPALVRCPHYERRSGRQTIMTVHKGSLVTVG